MFSARFCEDANSSRPQQLTRLTVPACTGPGEEPPARTATISRGGTRTDEP